MLKTTAQVLNLAAHEPSFAGYVQASVTLNSVFLILFLPRADLKQKDEEARGA